MRDKITFIDFETNGFGGSDVLSMSLIHSTGEAITRYYYPKEPYNESAIKINGLTKEVVTELRGACEYAPYFCDDLDIAPMFFETDTLVAHNIAFDFTFLPHIVKLMPLKLFCTMKSNAKYFDKNPKLMEACEHYDISVEEDQLHGSAYDTLLCEAIYQAMRAEDKMPNNDYLTKVYAARNWIGEKIHPFGSLKGLSASDMDEAQMESFLEKYQSAEAHEMFDEVMVYFNALLVSRGKL